ncbi:MAG: N-acetylglucosamine kinase [Armatimonadota bacterium]
MLTLRYVLGVDGGGSKCDAVLLAEDGTVVGWGRGGPTSVWYDTPEVIEASYADAVSGALAGVRGVRLWLSGHCRSPQARQAIKAAGEVTGRSFAGESEVAYAAAREQWGLIVLAGTGSFVHLLTRDGRTRHAGGLGPVLGDYGSAHEIGLRGLRAAFSSEWLASRRTSLREAIPAALGVEALRDVFHLVYEAHALNRRAIAALARTVDREAEGGDAIAIQCIRGAADELAELAVEVVAEMGVGDEELPVIASGSVARHSRIWWEHVCARIAAAAPRMRPIIPPVPPVVGAALVGLSAMGVTITDELMARIVQTQQRFLRAAAAAAENSQGGG